MTYRTVRYYQNLTHKDVLATGLTLEQAQAHCADPETSSKTCQSEVAKGRTIANGPWFDGYEEENPLEGVDLDGFCAD